MPAPNMAAHKVNEALRTWLKHLDLAPTGSITFSDLPQQVQQSLQDTIALSVQEVTSSIANELRRGYGTDISDLAWKGPTGGPFQLSIEHPGPFGASICIHVAMSCKVN